MTDYESLRKEAMHHASTIVQDAKQSPSLLIITHLDADGQVSAALIAKALMRKKVTFQVRVVGDLTPRVLASIREEGHDFIVFTDLGSGFVGIMKELFLDKWMVIDHHQTNASELATQNVFNAWKFGYDGGMEISSAGMVYQIITQMDASNIDLSWLPVVAALADRQDVSEEMSLTSLNKTVSEEAVRLNRLEVKKDLALYGRETKPIHEALASTSYPFLPGLTGIPDSCLAVLNTAGIKLKEGERWRTISELDEGERARVLDAIIAHLAPDAHATHVVRQLLGTAYTLIQEDRFSPLRDAREFGTLLNACGRMGKSGIGIAVCLGDRNKMLNEAEMILAEYRQTLNRYVRTVLAEGQKTVEKMNYTVIFGDGLIDENLVGAVCSILAGAPRFLTKPLLVRTITKEGEIKVSARLNTTFSPSINLGRALALAAESGGGVGGGHLAAAGARVPEGWWEEFARILDQNLER